MKALKIHENLNFEQGGDPYEKLDIGEIRFDNAETYVSKVLKREKYQEPDDFFDKMYELNYSNMKSRELYEMVMDLLDKTPKEYQKEWWDNEIGTYMELKDDGMI